MFGIGKSKAEKAAAKKYRAVPKETKNAEPEKYEPSAESALGTRGNAQFGGLPRQTDSGSSTILPKAGGNTGDILPTNYTDITLVAKDHPRLISIQKQIDKTISQISQAKKDMPKGGNSYDKYFGNQELNEMASQRKDHAEVRLQDLITKKDDLMSKYDDIVHEISTSIKQNTKNTSKTSPLPEYASKPKPAETRESESNFCDNCGKSLRPTAKFCSSCGTSLP